VTTTCATPDSSGTSTATPTAAGGTVYIIGGFAAIAQEVDTQLEAAGYNVVRIAGSDRFDTSVKVAQCEGSPDTVFLATGDIFADALSAGPAAAHATGGGSVLLTNAKIMPPEVSAYLATLSSPTVYAIGEAASVADPQATAVFGGDRFATSALVADKFFPGATVVGVATGADYPDALAGGAFMGVEGGPILMSDPFVLPSAVGLYLAEDQTTIGQAFLFGGTGALSNGIATDVSRLINDQP
jgi:putative cell wall-binding protein